MQDVFAKRIGGRLCLDFVNTVKGRIGRPGARRGRDYADRIVGERLVSYEALRRWAEAAGAAQHTEARMLAREGASRPADAAATLARAIALREALYRLFKTAIEEWTPEEHDLAVVNREHHLAVGHERLVGSPRFAWQWDRDPAALDRVLWTVVRSGVELLTSPDLERVGQCPGAECGWLFLDTSRSGRRQWCDMADCGNLAKVRRFRQRRARAG
jgi:predicted RNA-binding Zn ribbon-like protein